MFPFPIKGEKRRSKMSSKLHYYYLYLLLLAIFASFSFSLGRNEPEFSSLSMSKIKHSFGLMTRLSRASTPSSSSPKVFNVDAFGAKADGTDDSQAFNKAWNRACSSKVESVVFVPENKVYHLKPIKFSGPCKPFMTMRIAGVIKASPRRSDYEKDRRHWIVFEGVQNLRVRDDKK